MSSASSSVRHPEADLYPPDLRAEIDADQRPRLREVNNGVYSAGFARSQEAYERAFDTPVRRPRWLDELLGGARYLAGDADHRGRLAAFPTLVRFDPVYYSALPLQRPADRRLPEPVAVRARALPAARDRGDVRDGADQGALLHDPRRAEPEAHHSAGPARVDWPRRTGAADGRSGL